MIYSKFGGGCMADMAESSFLCQFITQAIYILPSSGPKLTFATFIAHFPQGYSLFFPIGGAMKPSSDKSLVVYDTSFNIVILRSRPSFRFILDHFRSPSPP